jgi:hypothetical protein
MHHEHSLESELEFLRSLGKRTWSSSKRSRLELLENYEKTLYLRVDWNAVDRAVLLAYLRTAIEEELTPEKRLAEYYRKKATW